MNEYGVVFTGGGTKGAYEVGAWKAIKELKLNVTAIVGTSIGAINGALAIQSDINKMEEIYKNIEIDNIISLNEEINKDKNIFDITNIIKIVKDYYKQKGFDNTPLKETLEKNIDVDKIYESNIDFGLMTYSYKDRTPYAAFKSEIPKSEFVSYLLASSCFPIYKAQNIDGKRYIDGGLYDNAPINMLIEKGYKNIIVIDISGIGLRRKVIDKNVYVKFIRNSEYLGGTFDFNKKRILNNVELGYLDTLKTFNNLQGHIYYFYKKDFSKLLKTYNLDTIYGLEVAAKIYKIDKYKIYSYDEFLNELLKRHKEAEEKYLKLKNKFVFKKIITEIKDTFSLINKGFGICLFKDIIKESSNNNKLINNLFSDYINSAKAIIELEYNNKNV